MGASSLNFDKTKVSNPPKAIICDCMMSDFKNILYQATKLTKRNQQVIQELQESRRTLFKDLPVKTPPELLRVNGLKLDSVLRQNNTEIRELQ